MEAFADLIESLPGDLSREVINELCSGRKMEEVRAMKAQLEIAQAQPERTWMEGLGQVRMTITPEAYHFWGQREGYACWRDKGFLHEFERDNPEVRVRNVARRTTLRVDGRRPSTGSGSLAVANERVSKGGIILCER